MMYRVELQVGHKVLDQEGALLDTVWETVDEDQEDPDDVDETVVRFISDIHYKSMDGDRTPKRVVITQEF